jgi:2-amino-4-hydroxy-6-hydroxymethyldihydropteridine diphosphokinase
MTYSEKNKTEIYLSLGSNLGDRKENILGALKHLSEDLQENAVISRFYESQALGFESKNQFLNICAKIETNISAKELLAKIHDIEQKLGRIRVEKAGYIDRIIDIDILFYGQTVINENYLKIPHPKIYDRKFVLIPLFDIAKTLVDPRTNRDIQSLIEACNDDSNLILYQE